MQTIHYGSRIAGAFLAFKHFGKAAPHPAVAIALGWLAGGFVANLIAPPK